MSMTDPIADLLTRIRNAQMVKHDRLEAPSSKLRLEICRILREQGYIENYQVVDGEPRDSIRIFLRYTDAGEPALRRCKRVSRPGRRVYRKKDEIRPALNGLGTVIVSTSQGLLTDTEARERGVGGEILCELW